MLGHERFHYSILSGQRQSPSRPDGMRKSRQEIPWTWHGTASLRQQILWSLPPKSIPHDRSFSVGSGMQAVEPQRVPLGTSHRRTTVCYEPGELSLLAPYSKSSAGARGWVASECRVWFWPPRCHRWYAWSHQRDHHGRVCSNRRQEP